MGRSTYHFLKSFSIAVMTLLITAGSTVFSQESSEIENIVLLAAPPTLVVEAGNDGLGTDYCCKADSNSGDYRWDQVRIFHRGSACYLVGRITNLSNYACELTKISWVIENEHGDVLADWDTYIHFLDPGESKPFKLMLPAIPEASLYRLSLTPGFIARARGFQLNAQVCPYADRGVAYISLLGKVVNQGSDRYDFLKIIVEFMDDEDRLLDVDWAFLNYLGPGESKSFTVYTAELGATRWEVIFD